jgi:hypothetical protein
MHPAIQFLIFWALAFLSLCVALVLFSIFYGLIGNDLILRSAGQEAAIAGFASLIEGASVWLVATYVPTAGRALFVPVFAVAVLYKIAHLEDWNRYDIVLFMVFQLVIVLTGACLFLGQYQVALVTLAVFGVCLFIIASIAKSL